MVFEREVVKAPFFLIYIVIIQGLSDCIVNHYYKLQLLFEEGFWRLNTGVKLKHNVGKKDIK